MSSRFLFECGQRIDKNLFSGNQVAHLVAEEDVDRNLEEKHLVQVQVQCGESRRLATGAS